MLEAKRRLTFATLTIDPLLNLIATVLMDIAAISYHVVCFDPRICLLTRKNPISRTQPLEHRGELAGCMTSRWGTVPSVVRA
jgi:hypothetical protein